MKTTIAILATTAALAAAMQASLEKRYPNADFVHISRLTDRPANAQVASLGLPSFVPGSDGVKILSFGSKIIQDATKEQRAHQWTVLRDPNATTEAVLAELGNWQEYTILQGESIANAKSTIADIKLALVETEDTEAKLALYKEGFNLLAGMLG